MRSSETKLLNNEDKVIKIYLKLAKTKRMISIETKANKEPYPFIVGNNIPRCY